MKEVAGGLVQDPATQAWHLAWQVRGEDAKDGRVDTWCHLELRWDDPQKSFSQLNGLEDMVHDECWRKAEEMQ